ncbi:unnamed protein product [Lactuca saligna]|uniref:Vps16 C-terminal domain-containing protein n=1 Tax=Lactuca saligna TaxID=75948 RepID=A0AA35ZGQ3_LACSI|nr:unnamed protein product [Lactuca saligna]
MDAPVPIVRTEGELAVAEELGQNVDHIIVKVDELLTSSVLIGQLVNAHQHLLTLRITNYLGMNQEVVIMHLACSKLTVSSIVLDATPLEILLDKVPLLLGIGEEDTTLNKVTESGDTDLVYLVLFHIWHKRPTLELFGMIQARPIAHNLFIRYARYYMLD